MLDLLVCLIKLPFVLLGVVLSVVFGAIGVLLSIVGWVLGGLWTAFAFGVACLLIIWLLAKLSRDKRATAIQR